MKYRGLSPIQQGTIWVIFMVAVGAVVGATGPRAVSALADLTQVAPSRLPWVATRVVAFLSYFAITGSVVYGLLLSTKILDAIAHRPVSFSLHQDLVSRFADRWPLADGLGEDLVGGLDPREGSAATAASRCRTRVPPGTRMVAVR